MKCGACQTFTIWFATLALPTAPERQLLRGKASVAVAAKRMRHLPGEPLLNGKPNLVKVGDVLVAEPHRRQRPYISRRYASPLIP
jgi:hypothetical protein